MVTIESFRSGSPPLEVPEEKAEVLRLAIRALDEAGIAHAIDGGIALFLYTGTRREVHDLDLRVMPDDVEPAMQALEQKGFRSEVKHKQWLAQAFRDDVQVDLVFGLGSWQAWVDQAWINHGRPAEVLGERVLVTPAEEMFWAKAFRCSRWAYDGNDLFHLLEAVGDQMDWAHLVARFGVDWEVLLSHLILFRYVFPSRADVIPDEVLDDLLGRLNRTRRHPWMGDCLCRGPIIDGSDTYEQLITERGYIDARQARWEQRSTGEKSLAPSEVS